MREARRQRSASNPYEEGERDEVIASTLTFIRSVSPITFFGATPVFIDSDRTTWNMDPDLLEEELDACYRWGRMPRAVIPTDLYGQCADYGRILPICEKYGVPVVADAAEALGAMYLTQDDKTSHAKAQRREGEKRRAKQPQRKQLQPQTSNLSGLWHHAGVGAKAAIFSFNGNKIITTSGGGMLVSEDKEFIEKARNLSQQARDPAPHYEHSRIGYNYRMSNVLAALGRGQLRVLDERVQKKKWIFDYYKQVLGDLPGIEFMPEAPYGRSTRWLTVVLITPEEAGIDREHVRLALEAENIEARPVWKPMHLQPVFDCALSDAGYKMQDAERKHSHAKAQGRESVKQSTSIPQRRIRARLRGGAVAEDLFTRGLCLPSGTAMTEEDLERVVKAIRKCWRTRDLRSATAKAGKTAV